MIPTYIKKEDIPHKPGVYIYRNNQGKEIYVGKAINLYNRVKSYFFGRLDAKTASLVEEIASCQTIVVQSELEALLLEANLIKKYLPKFNIRLTDDKDYLYIKVTNEVYPRIITARKNELSQAKEYFGPFPSSKAVSVTLKKLRKIFPWCSNPPNQEIKLGASKMRACFSYHLGLCPGVCIGKIDHKSYLKNINNFSKFMLGKKEILISNLEKEMKNYSNLQDYERAQETKRVIDGINYLLQPNNIKIYLENPNFTEDQAQVSLNILKSDLGLDVLPGRIECIDISNIGGKFAVGSLVVLTNGEVDKKWYRKFKIKLENSPNDVAMMEEVVRRRLKHVEWPLPDLLLVDGGKGQVSTVLRVLIEHHLNIPLFGLAKREENIINQQLQVKKLSKYSLSIRLLQKIRDEAHRFAISYHRKLRAEAALLVS